MADTMVTAEFWLPSEFLTDDDILIGKENLSKNRPNIGFGANFGFPTDFPYEFGSYGSSSVLSSPVESVVGSTETESDEEDLLTGLTRQLACSALYENSQKITSATQKLEKPWVLSGSPQSTLSGIGSWSGRVSPNFPSQVTSPPPTPLGGNDGWDLMYSAAGQVARLKMNGGEWPPKGSGLLGPTCILSHPQHPTPPASNPNAGIFGNQSNSHNLSQTNPFGNVRQDQSLKQQCSSIWGKPTREDYFSQQNQIKQHLISQNRERVHAGVGFESSGGYVRPLDLPQSAWPPLRVQHQGNQNQPSQHDGSRMRAVFLGGSGVKRECAGTGVFLPRRYGNLSESRKKPGCSTALLPARVVQALNKNFVDMAAESQVAYQSHARLVPDYDYLVARRNAMLSQQRRNLRLERSMNHEICLPHEWTY